MTSHVIQYTKQQKWTNWQYSFFSVHFIWTSLGWWFRRVWAMYSSRNLGITFKAERPIWEEASMSVDPKGVHAISVVTFHDNPTWSWIMIDQLHRQTDGQWKMAFLSCVAFGQTNFVIVFTAFLVFKIQLLANKPITILDLFVCFSVLNHKSTHLFCL